MQADDRRVHVHDDVEYEQVGDARKEWADDYSCWPEDRLLVGECENLPREQNDKVAVAQILLEVEPNPVGLRGNESVITHCVIIT